MAIVTQQGTTLSYGAGTPTPLGQIVEIDAPELDRKAVDTTDLSTTGSHTSRPSALYSQSVASMKLHYDPKLASHVHLSGAALSGAVEPWIITFSDGSSAAFPGFVTKFKGGDKIESKDEKNLEASVSIQPTDDIVFTAGAGAGP